MAIATRVISAPDLEESFGREVPCDQEDGCDQPGEWLYAHTCCGSRWVVCTPHHKRADQLATIPILQWACKPCGHKFPVGQVPYRLISRI
jgi:hypothetical protein